MPRPAIPSAAEVAHRVLEGRGAALLVDAEHLTVEHEVVAGQRADDVDDTTESRSVMSLRLRVNRRTSSPRRWAWTRAPSSFHSTEASPVAASASATSLAGEASIGCTARSGVSVSRGETGRTLGEGDLGR